MTVQTTVVGAWVKGAVGNWFTEEQDGRRMMGRGWRPHLRGEEEPELVDEMVREVVVRQAELGVDLVTDGEVGREGYYMHFIRRGLVGVDLATLSDKVMRDGAFISQVPTVVDRVTGSPSPWCYEEFLRAKEACPPGTTIKYTLPGPMTMMDGSYNHFYKDQREMARDVVRVLQREVLALAAHGCTHIQLDEPVMMRYPKEALEFGVSDAADVFLGCPPTVNKTIHLCCGYPDRFEPTDYKKADKNSYKEILMALDKAGFDWASIEDAEAVNDLETILSGLSSLGVVLGVVTVARGRVETVEDIVSRAREALLYIPRKRLMLAPDCGLGFLSQELAEKKLKNMVAAASIINKES